MDHILRPNVREDAAIDNSTASSCLSTIKPLERSLRTSGLHLSSLGMGRIVQSRYWTRDSQLYGVNASAKPQQIAIYQVASADTYGRVHAYLPLGLELPSSAWIHTPPMTALRRGIYEDLPQAYRLILLSMTLLLASSLLARLALSFASVTNITIDDQNGDASTGVLPTYMPVDTNPWIYGPDCHGCSLAPDASKALGGTWHDASVWEPGRVPDTFPYVEFSFTGTAIYMFCIVCDDPTLSDNGVASTNLSFTLDGNTVGTYFHLPSASGFLYNEPVYVGTSLSNTRHTVRMTIEANYVTNSSNALFDYAIYTSESEDTTSSSVDLSPTSSETAPSPNPSSQPTTSATQRSAAATSQPSTTATSQSGTTTTSQSSTIATSLPMTTPTSRSSTTSTTPAVSSGGNHWLAVGPMAGGVAGGVVFLLAIVAGLLYTLRRRRRSAILRTAEPFNVAQLEATTGSEKPSTPTTLSVPDLLSSAPHRSWSGTKSTPRSSASPGTAEINVLRPTGEMQQADPVLVHQQSVDEEGPSDVRSLRARMEALQSDMERLRAEQVQWSSPPAYNHGDGASMRL